MLAVKSTPSNCSNSAWRSKTSSARSKTLLPVTLTVLVPSVTVTPNKSAKAGPASVAMAARARAGRYFMARSHRRGAGGRARGAKLPRRYRTPPVRRPRRAAARRPPRRGRRPRRESGRPRRASGRGSISLQRSLQNGNGDALGRSASRGAAGLPQIGQRRSPSLTPTPSPALARLWAWEGVDGVGAGLLWPFDSVLAGAESALVSALPLESAFRLALRLAAGCPSWRPWSSCRSGSRFRRSRRP